MREQLLFGFGAEMSLAPHRQFAKCHIDKDCWADSSLHTYTLAQTSRTFCCSHSQSCYSSRLHLLPPTTFFTIKQDTNLTKKKKKCKCSFKRIKHIVLLLKGMPTMCNHSCNIFNISTNFNKWEFLSGYKQISWSIEINKPVK